MDSKPFAAHWRLKEILEREGLSAYQLNQELDGYVPSSTVYRYARNEVQSPNLETLGWILWGLHRLTGDVYRCCDVVRLDLQHDFFVNAGKGERSESSDETPKRRKDD